MKRAQAVKNRNMKRPEDKASSEKLSGGMTHLKKISCTTLKSSIPFCRSRIFLKKSFDVSPAGLIVRGGARGGPFKVYEVDASCGGGGCRTRYAGIRMKKRAQTIGNTERR